MMNPFTNNSQPVKSLVLMALMGSSMSQTMLSSTSYLMFSWSMSNINTSQLNISILIDPMSMVFSWTVIFISMNIMLFSKFYMMNEKGIMRFNQLVISFILSMNLFIYSGDLIFMLLGWDGLGMTSFLLVIYYQNQKSLGGGLVTLMTNRLGDIMLILVLACTQTYASWSTNMTNWSIKESTIILLMLGSMTKSAQLPFSVWLPEAMAAPTPVSALVHSSTLVTAGVFLMIRMNKMLLYNNLQMPMLFVSTFTMMSAGVWGSISKDTKKIVAFSTLSHLGIMVLSVSAGYEMLAYLHLLMHAMFKALLFMCVGVDIMVKSHKQNHMNNLSGTFLHFMSKSKLISLLSLNALPFLSGYISKDTIIEMSMMENKTEITTMLLVGAGFTTLYSMRLWNLTKSELSYKQTTSNYMIIKTLLFLMLAMTLLTITSMIMGLFSINIINLEQPSLTMNEHKSIPLTLMMGIMMYFTSSMPSPMMSFFFTSLMLQKPTTKKFILPTMSTSKKIIYTIENGLSQWTLVHLTSIMMLKSSSKILQQQKNSPTTIILLALTMMSMSYSF